MNKAISVSIPLLLSCAATIDPIEPPEPPPEYNRKDWKHWIDADKDCQDTRQEVLIAESTTPVVFEEGKQCRVESGTWLDPYTGKTFTAPSSLDVDHVVPLRAAHDSGGAYWDASRREDFANDLEDPRALRAVALGANRSKGSKAPDEWLPENEGFRCQYIEEYVALVTRWELDFTFGQIYVINYMIHICNEGGVPPLPQ
jgi:hypothetical protein